MHLFTKHPLFWHYIIRTKASLNKQGIEIGLATVEFKWNPEHYSGVGTWPVDAIRPWEGIRVAPGTLLGSLLLSDYAAEPSCCRLFFNFFCDVFHVVPCLFIFPSTQFCLTFFIFLRRCNRFRNRENGRGEGHKEKNTNTYCVRTEWGGVPLAWLSVPLYFFILFFWLYLSISTSLYLSFFIFLPLSLHFFLPPFLSFFSFCRIPHPSSVIRSSPCPTYLTPVLPPFRHTVCNGVLQRKWL